MVFQHSNSNTNGDKQWYKVRCFLSSLQGKEINMSLFFIRDFFIFSYLQPECKGTDMSQYTAHLKQKVSLSWSLCKYSLHGRMSKVARKQHIVLGDVLYKILSWKWTISKFPCWSMGRGRGETLSSFSYCFGVEGRSHVSSTGERVVR